MVLWRRLRIEVCKRSPLEHLAELWSESEHGEVDISRYADDTPECGMWL